MTSYLKYIVKDLRDVEYGVVCHGVNCQGVMRSGVAKDLRERWPEIFTTYKAICDTDKFQPRTIKPNPTEPCDIRHPLGHADIVYVGAGTHTIFVANLFTQEFYGREPNTRYAIPVAVRLALEKAAKHAYDWSIPIYMPKIGCGLGGLNWDTDVLPIVEEVARNNAYIDFYICDKEQK